MGNPGYTVKSGDTGNSDLSRTSNNGRFKDITSSNSSIIFPEAKTYSQRWIVGGASINALKLQVFPGKFSAAGLGSLSVVKSGCSSIYLCKGWLGARSGFRLVSSTGLMVNAELLFTSTHSTHAAKS